MKNIWLVVLHVVRCVWNLTTRAQSLFALFKYAPYIFHLSTMLIPFNIIYWQYKLGSDNTAFNAYPLCTVCYWACTKCNKQTEKDIKYGRTLTRRGRRYQLSSCTTCHHPNKQKTNNGFNTEIKYTKQIEASRVVHEHHFKLLNKFVLNVDWNVEQNPCFRSVIVLVSLFMFCHRFLGLISFYRWPRAKTCTSVTNFD